MNYIGAVLNVFGYVLFIVFAEKMPPPRLTDVLEAFRFISAALSAKRVTQRRHGISRQAFSPASTKSDLRAED